MQAGLVVVVVGGLALQLGLDLAVVVGPRTHVAFLLLVGEPPSLPSLLGQERAPGQLGIVVHFLHEWGEVGGADVTMR